MTSLDTEGMVFTQISEDLHPGCELRESGCPQAAEWIMHRSPCCAERDPHAFACSTCKDIRLLNQIAVACPKCEHVWFDSVTAYVYIEPIR